MQRPVPGRVPAVCACLAVAGRVVSATRFGSTLLVGGVIATLAGCTSTSDGTSDGSTTAANPVPASVTARAASSSATPSDSSRVAGTTSPTSTTPFTSVSVTTTRKPAPTPSTPKPSGTATVGPLDDTAVRWFTALCTGLSSADTSKAHQETGELAARRSAAAGVFDGAAKAYRTMTDELSGIGAPSIPNGQALQDSLLKAAPEMADAAEHGADDITSAADEPGVSKAIDLADDAVTEARAPLADFAEAMAAPALADQLEKIEACRPLFT